MAGISAKNNAVAQLPPELPGPLPAADIRQAGGPSERRAAGDSPLWKPFSFLMLFTNS